MKVNIVYIRTEKRANNPKGYKALDSLAEGYKGIPLKDGTKRVREYLFEYKRTKEMIAYVMEIQNRGLGDLVKIGIGGLKKTPEGWDFEED